MRPGGDAEPVPQGCAGAGGNAAGLRRCCCDRRRSPAAADQAPIDCLSPRLPADGPVITNSRRLLHIDPDTLFAACSKAYRFQWWGWALQTTFCTLVAAYWCAKFKHTGVMIIGGTITVLAMIFANDTLQASDDTSGKAFRCPPADACSAAAGE